MAKDFLEFKRLFDLHGASRAAIRFVRGVFETYQDDKGARLLEALDSWDTDSVVSAFNDALIIKPCEEGYSLQYSIPMVLESGDIVNSSRSRFEWGEHAMEGAMLQITHEVVPLIEHTPASG